MKPSPAPLDSAAACTGAWRPLFAGEEAEPYRAACDEIAAAVARDLTGPACDRTDVTLTEGAPGLAVHAAYRHRATGDPADRERAVALLEHAFAATAERVLTPQLYAGLAGVGWAGHVVQTVLELEDDLVAELDEPLADYVAGDPPAGDYDLVRGVTGLGCYFLQRLPRPAAVRGLTAAVSYLQHQAVPHDGGTAWLTPPHVLGSSTRGISPEGHYDIGPAHGAAGAAVLLAAAVEAGVATSRAEELLEGVVTWLLARELPEGTYRFPNWIDPTSPEPRCSRLAWCYGDLGVAVALLNAARRVGRMDWEEKALSIARRMAAVTEEQSKVVDGGICHGSAGAAHLFNRLHQATGEPAFATAARAWCRSSLALRRAGEGVAGYLAYFPAVDPDNPWVPHRGLLMGAAGIGLVLEAALGDAEPAWDSFLVADVPLVPPAGGSGGAP